MGEQPEGLVDLIHKLHGSCGYTAMPRLKKAVPYPRKVGAGGHRRRDLEPELLGAVRWRWIMWPASAAGWGVNPDSCATRLIRPTPYGPVFRLVAPVSVSATGMVPDRGATHLIRTTNTTAPAGYRLSPICKTRLRYAPSLQVGGGIGQRFIKGYRWCYNALNTESSPC